MDTFLASLYMNCLPYFCQKVLEILWPTLAAARKPKRAESGVMDCITGMYAQVKMESIYKVARQERKALIFMSVMTTRGKTAHASLQTAVISMLNIAGRYWLSSIIVFGESTLELQVGGGACKRAWNTDRFPATGYQAGTECCSLVSRAKVCILSINICRGCFLSKHPQSSQVHLHSTTTTLQRHQPPSSVHQFLHHGARQNSYQALEGR